MTRVVSMLPTTSLFNLSSQKQSTTTIKKRRRRRKRQDLILPIIKNLFDPQNLLHSLVPLINLIRQCLGLYITVVAKLVHLQGRAIGAAVDAALLGRRTSSPAATVLATELALELAAVLFFLRHGELNMVAAQTAGEPAAEQPLRDSIPPELELLGPVGRRDGDRVLDDVEDAGVGAGEEAPPVLELACLARHGLIQF